MSPSSMRWDGGIVGTEITLDDLDAVVCNGVFSVRVVGEVFAFTGGGDVVEDGCAT